MIIMSLKNVEFILESKKIEPYSYKLLVSKPNKNFLNEYIKLLKIMNN